MGQHDEEIINDETALMVLIGEEYETSDEELNEDLEVIKLLASLPKEESAEQPVKWDKYDDNEWLNPFATEGGGETTFSAEVMEYPLLKGLETTYSAISTADSRRPQEPVMGPPMYPPAVGGTSQQRGMNVPEIKSKVSNLRGGYAQQNNERFNLPNAQASQGAILVLPEDIGQYSDGRCFSHASN